MRSAFFSSNYIFTIAVLLLCIQNAQAQTPKEILHRVNARFEKVKDYSADIFMQFDIPSVKLDPIKGKVFYKAPDKFRIRTKGIVFLPKQNPYESINTLRDTNSYMAFIAGTEKIGDVNCSLINLIPNTDGDLVMGKFWVDASRSVILKSQLTTKSNGTLQIDNQYGSRIANALPDKIRFTFDVAKFKVPKAVAMEINSKSEKKTNLPDRGTGTITLDFTNYLLNQKLPDSVFTDKE